MSQTNLVLAHNIHIALCKLRSNGTLTRFLSTCLSSWWHHILGTPVLTRLAQLVKAFARWAGGPGFDSRVGHIFHRLGKLLLIDVVIGIFNQDYGGSFKWLMCHVSVTFLSTKAVLIIEYQSDVAEWVKIFQNLYHWMEKIRISHSSNEIMECNGYFMFCRSL